MNPRVLYGRSRSGAGFLKSRSPAAWFRKGDWTVTGAGVSQWNDSSGNARHLKQGTDSARPQGQADGSIIFNGTDEYLKCDAFTLNQPTTVVMALKQVGWTLSDHIFDGNTTNSMVVYQSATAPRIRQFAGANGAENSGLAVSSVGVIAAVFNGAGSTLRVNNVTPAPDNPGAGNAGGFTLGSSAAPGEWANIQVYEAAIFASALSTTEQDRVIRYMAGVAGVSL